MLGNGVVGKLRILLSPREKRVLVGIVLLMTLCAVMELAGLGLLMPLVALFTKPELLDQNRYLRLISSWPVFSDRRIFLVSVCGAAVTVYALKTLLAFFTVRAQSRFIADKQRMLCGRLLAVESSCGDSELDRAATAIPVAGLAKSEPPPRFIVVRWPERPADKEAKP